jgi:hypothetical protein
MTTVATRSVIEGRQPQGVREAVRYQITVKPSAVSVPPDAVRVTDETTGSPQDVTETTVTGSASVQSGKLVLPLIANLLAGHLYRAACLYSDGTSTLEVYVEIEAER